MQDRYDRFTTAITDIYQSIQKIRMREMKTYGLRSGHVSCLHLLREAEEGLTSGDLAEKSDLDKAAVSRYMSQMKDLGFAVLDETAPRHYRRKWQLTEKGRAAADQIDGLIVAAVSAVGDSLTPAERASLYTSLEKIQASLKLYLTTGKGS